MANHITVIRIRCAKCRRQLASAALEDGRLVIDPDEQQRQAFERVAYLERDALTDARQAAQDAGWTEEAKARYRAVSVARRQFEERRRSKPDLMIGARAATAQDADRELGVLGPRTQRRSLRQGRSDHVRFRHRSAQTGSTCTVPGAGLRPETLLRMVTEALASGAPEVFVR